MIEKYIKEVSWCQYEGISYRYLYCSNVNFSEIIVAVGGAFQNLEVTLKNEIGLLENNSVLFIELPGFGESEAPPKNANFEYYSNCILNVVDILGVRSCWGYAYSYGTGPLFKCASINSNIFKGLILSGTSTYFTNKMIEDMEKLIYLARNDKKSFPDEFIKIMCSTEIEKILNTKLCRTLLKRMLVKTKPDDIDLFADNYSRLLLEHEAVDYYDGPLLTFNGEYDSFVPQSRLSEFKNLCKDHYVDQVPNSDHFFHLENYNYSSLIVNRFIDKITKRESIEDVIAEEA